MSGRDLTPRQVAELDALAATAGLSCSVYAANLRKLLAMRAAVMTARAADQRAGVPLETGRVRDIPAVRVSALDTSARAATISSSQVKMRPDDLRTLLAMRAELLVRAAAAAHFDAAVLAAELAGGAREIKSRAAGRRLVLVGADHGGKAQVRTYGFDLQHLAGFLGLHPETTRKAIRDGALVPTDLGSIHAYKLATEARKAPKGKL